MQGETGPIGCGVTDGERGLLEFGERDAQLLAGAEKDGALDKIFELTNVAGPGVIDKCVHRFGGNVLDGFVQAAAEILHEVTNEQGHVFAAFAQRRNLNRKNIEAIVEIAAKFAVGDEAREVAIGGGHDADVDGLRAIAAEAFELLLLQNAEKFRLEFERNVADLVEKERAVIGELEAADFLIDRAGKSAAFVAEEFGFEQATGNRGAIDFDEGALFARAEIVNGAGDDLLAGAGFAEDENGAAGGRDEFDLREDFADRGALADDFLEIECAANFFLEIKLFFGELGLERVDLFEGERVFDGDGDLRGDLLDELDVGGSENVDAAAGEIERAEGAAAIRKRDATDDLQAFGAEDADDFAGVLVDFGAARNERAIFDDGAAGGRRVARDDHFGFDEQALAAGKIERVNFEQAIGGIE